MYTKENNKIYIKSYKLKVMNLIVLTPFQKDVHFRFFTFIKKKYQILVTNTLFSVIKYSPKNLTNKILINTIIFFKFKIYN